MHVCFATSRLASNQTLGDSGVPAAGALGVMRINKIRLSREKQQLWSLGRPGIERCNLWSWRTIAASSSEADSIWVPGQPSHTRARDRHKQSHRWNRNPRPQPQASSTFVFLIESSRSYIFLNWLSWALVGVGGSDFIVQQSLPRGTPGSAQGPRPRRRSRRKTKNKISLSLSLSLSLCMTYIHIYIYICIYMIQYKQTH